MAYARRWDNSRTQLQSHMPGVRDDDTGISVSQRLHQRQTTNNQSPNCKRSCVTMYVILLATCATISLGIITGVLVSSTMSVKSTIHGLDHGRLSHLLDQTLDLVQGPADWVFKVEPGQSIPDDLSVVQRRVWDMLFDPLSAVVAPHMTTTEVTTASRATLEILQVALPLLEQTKGLVSTVPETIGPIIQSIIGLNTQIAGILSDPALYLDNAGLLTSNERMALLDTQNQLNTWLATNANIDI
jgi:hypothetical protein